MHKDMYRIIFKESSNNSELVLATSDNYEEIKVDWSAINNNYHRLLSENPEQRKDLTTMFEKLRINSQVKESYFSVSSTYKEPHVDVYHDISPIITSHPQKTLLDYKLIRTLGTGSFGRVLLAQETSSKIYQAIKVIKKAVIMKLKQVEHTVNERDILMSVKCPFLLCMSTYFQDSQNIYFVLEYINGGELFTHIHRHRHFSSFVAKFFAAQVLLALEYLHDMEVIYRDLKPENILLDAQGNVRITDFGFAKIVAHKTYTLCGTPEYLAPEIILSKGYGAAVDWWALGVLVYEMRAGRTPFADDNQLEMYRRIVEGVFEYPSHFEDSEKDFISKLLVGDTTRRYGCLKNGTKDMKMHAYFDSTNFGDIYSSKVKSPYIPIISGQGDDSNYDKFEEEIIKWDITSLDPYKEVFKNF